MQRFHSFNIQKGSTCLSIDVQGLEDGVRFENRETRDE